MVRPDTAWLPVGFEPGCYSSIIHNVYSSLKLKFYELNYHILRDNNIK